MKTNRQQQIEHLQDGLQSVNAHLKDLASMGVAAALERNKTTGDYCLMIPRGTKLD